ncbi:hypothetical protein [Delftia phage PhiW-14]|uniref:Uncharacterized protein n=1 Tax=Delftia phage PhiW-14 TaxID=665032 RepID=C9DGF0_BPW14|nr:hypothetical protein DP-phiW-14_gp180 [Delftia phage PhiW-14]ACV50201.1 hypothetical protein [Delftia phage PhiW-14]
MNTGVWMPKRMDLWEAIEADAFVAQRLKPKPYKDWVELDTDQLSIWSCKPNLVIMLVMSGGDQVEGHKQVRQSMANMVAEAYPELATKHNLVIDRKHEYWRTK